jgi:sugar/nucleoside kinase (ribokinase family)
MENKKFDVVVVGELNVDLILNRLEKFPEVGKEIIARNMTLTLGSSSAIFASNLSSLGARVSFIGKLGYDSFATEVMVKLKSKNVNTTYITKSQKSFTGATIVFNYNEDRAMITYPGAMEEFNIQDITNAMLADASHLHVSSVFLQKGLRPDLLQLFQRAKALNMTTSLDPQWDPDEKWDLNLQALLPYVDVFFPNAVELLSLTKGKTIESSIDLIKSSAKTIVVKNGSEGSVLWDGQKLIYQKAFVNPKIEDCIGAGDSFGAGFIKKYIERKSLTECLEYASLMGAINTTQAGGTAAFKDIATIKQSALSKFNTPI